MARLINCPQCKRKNVAHEARGYCVRCYQKVEASKDFVPYPNHAHKNHHSKDWVCPKCHKNRPHRGNNLCRNCWNIKWEKDHHYRRPKKYVPVPIDFSQFFGLDEIGYFLSQKPFWQCKTCGSLCRYTMRYTYNYSLKTYPNCIPCFERLNGVSYDNSEMFETLKSFSRMYRNTGNSKTDF